MNDLLFYALLAILLYYFFYYLPQQKKNINPHSTKPLTQTQFTQTEPDPITTTKNDEPGAIKCPGPRSIQYEPESKAIPDPQAINKLQTYIQQKEQTIISLNNSYNKLETKTKAEIDNLKNTLKEKDNQIQALKALENQVDNLTKNIQELNNEIED